VILGEHQQQVQFTFQFIVTHKCFSNYISPLF
jgi:hypothetical protein